MVKPVPFRSDDTQEPPLLSVIVPVYNEVATLDRVLKAVFSVPLEMQVIVVDDGSCDGSSTVLSKWQQAQGLHVLRHQCNRGKGSAIRTAIPFAQGRWTLIQDADLEVSPAEYPCLLEPLLRGEAQVVYGSRYLNSDNSRRIVPFWSWGVWLLNMAVWWLYRVRLTDEATCFKVFPTLMLKQMDLQCQRFEFCPEVTAKACRMGLSILEIPIAYRPRGIQSGKKIRPWDGVLALLTLWKWRHWSPPGEDLKVIGNSDARSRRVSIISTPR